MNAISELLLSKWDSYFLGLWLAFPVLFQVIWSLFDVSKHQYLRLHEKGVLNPGLWSIQRSRAPHFALIWLAVLCWLSRCMVGLNQIAQVAAGIMQNKGTCRI